MSTSMRDWAITYAHRGIPIFPLIPREKVPLLPVRQGGRGFRDATTDVDQIDKWWRACPDANIGATPLVGNVLRQAVIDIDLQNGGGTSWEHLVSVHGVPPVTLTARTGQGGRHLWFWLSERGRSKIAQGIDCKFGDTGYVVMPPPYIPSLRGCTAGSARKLSLLRPIGFAVLSADHLRRGQPSVRTATQRTGW